MDTKLKNSRKSKTSDSNRPLLNLSGNINLKRSDEYVAPSNFSIYYTQKNIEKLIKNNKEFELPDGFYFVSDIQDYFQYILKKHEKGADDLPIRIYANKLTFNP